MMLSFLEKKDIEHRVRRVVTSRYRKSASDEIDSIFANPEKTCKNHSVSAYNVTGVNWILHKSFFWNDDFFNIKSSW